MRKPIAYLTSFYARAGDTFIRREVEELRRIGWNVHTFSIRRADDVEVVSEDIAREQRTTDYVLERRPWTLLAAFARMSVRSPARMIRAIRQAAAIRWPGMRSWVWHLIYLLEASYLAEQLVARNIGLLHNHIAMNSATVAMLASTLSGVPFSMTVHGPHDFFAPEHWGLGSKIAASSLTVCISDFGRSQCMLFSSPPDWRKLRVVRCGLDPRFLDGPASPPPPTPRLTCAGRLCAEKGQLLLVDAVAALRDQGIDVQLVLVGDGPARKEIEVRSQELGIASMVRLLGWQASDEVRRTMLESRAVVLPSFAEGIPVVLMEAMALRRPVVATYVGGVPELVRPGESGWLVPAGSVEDLSRALREALGSSSDQLARMGERARQQVLERHDLSVEVRKLSALFESTIRDGEPAGPPNRAD